MDNETMKYIFKYLFSAIVLIDKEKIKDFVISGDPSKDDFIINGVVTKDDLLKLLDVFYSIFKENSGVYVNSVVTGNKVFVGRRLEKQFEVIEHKNCNEEIGVLWYRHYEANFCNSGYPLEFKMRKV